MPSRPDPEGTDHGSHAGHGHSLTAGPGADQALTGRGGSTRRRVITALAAILVPLTLALIAAMVLLFIAPGVLWKVLGAVLTVGLLGRDALLVSQSRRLALAHQAEGADN